jgi:transposase-like protein
MQAFYYNYGGPGTMRNPRKSIEEQYALVIECRSSGLSNQQWCMQHDIKPGTFYNWVKRLRQKACYDIPAATGRDALTASVRQEAVKVDIVPDQAPDKQQVLQPSQLGEVMKCESAETVPIEIRTNEVIYRITNDVDPRLLSQILRNLGGSAC